MSLVGSRIQVHATDVVIRFQPLPFFSDGLASTFIFCPLSRVSFNSLNASATSAGSTIPTKPHPRQYPNPLSVTASAVRTSPAREKCARRSLLVTELARLPTYTLGIHRASLYLSRFGLSQQATLCGP